MIPRQRRGFFNFLCAFMPGASEMYMGFMKMGASMMLTFMGGIMAIGFLGLSDAFVAIPAVMWFYGFFHARNLTTCHPNVFMTIKDDYFWNDFIDGKKINIKSESARKVIAWALIIIGVSALWSIGRNSVEWLVGAIAPGRAGFVYDVLDSIPRILIALIIIFVGFNLISGKKKELFITDKTFDIASGMNSADFPKAPSAPDFTTAAPKTPDFTVKGSDNVSTDNNTGEEKMNA